MASNSAKKPQESPCMNSLLSSCQKKQLLGLLQNWKDKGELESKLAFIFSDDGKQRLLGLALCNGAISSEQYNREYARTVVSSLPESVFGPFSRVPDNCNQKGMSQKEKDDTYHSMAGECYPGILRTKCGTYGGNKAFLMVRIRTTDTEFDTAMSDIIGPNFKCVINCDNGKSYYEISAIGIPRETISQAKSELDEVAWDFLTFKEEKQGLGDKDTINFKQLIKNPDHSKYG